MTAYGAATRSGDWRFARSADGQDRDRREQDSVGGRLYLLKLRVSRAPGFHARVAKSNTGSVRMLERCRFVKVRKYETPEDDHYAACVDAVYKLR